MYLLRVQTAILGLGSVTPTPRVEPHMVHLREYTPPGITLVPCPVSHYVLDPVSGVPH